MKFLPEMWNHTAPGKVCWGIKIQDSQTGTGPVAAWSGIVVEVARTKGIRYEICYFRVHMCQWDDFG